MLPVESELLQFISYYVSLSQAVAVFAEWGWGYQELLGRSTEKGSLIMGGHLLTPCGLLTRASGKELQLGLSLFLVSVLA